MPNKNSNQAFRTFSKSFLCTAIILFASNVMLNAQPFSKFTTGKWQSRYLLQQADRDSHWAGLDQRG